VVGIAGTSTLSLHWNGATWSIVSSPNPETNPKLNAVTAISATDIWAVSSQWSSSGSSYAQTLVEQWNGSAWNVVPSPSVAGTNSVFYGVAAFGAHR
jgi:hypothetical protein